MFTRMAKFVLGILMLVVVIMAFVVAIGMDAGFWGFVLTLLLGSVLLCSFGILVELANNVMDIKQILSKQNK